MQIDFEVWSRA